MGDTIVGLDIGTTKVCALVVATDDENHINVLGVGRSPTDGLTRGVVTNIEKTVLSIQRAVEEAEAQSGIPINSVIVGIAGDHIQSFQSRGVITISNPEHEIAQKDVDRLIDDTKKVALPSDRRIIHVIPQEFIVDGQDGVYDPVGMSGVRLEANVHIITGLITAAQNVFKCVKRAGLEVSDIVLEPLASSYAVLDDEEKEVGVVLLDIGGGTTDLAIFEGRTIRHIAVIGIAGKRVTDDIRKGLGILTEQAERLKKEYGYAYLPDIVDDEVISIPGIGGRSPIEINKSLLCRIVQPRMEEILEIVALEIKRSGYSRHLFAGAVLTGGGSLIKGIDKLSRDILGMPVKIGIPTGFHAGLVKEVENPMFATGVGLVLHAIRYRNQSAVTFKSLEKKNRGLGSVFTRIRSWFEEL